VAFMKENNIKHHQISMPGNKEPFVKIPPQAIKAALVVILDRRNHPILIHCNKGKVCRLLDATPFRGSTNLGHDEQHRTGCVVGCLRKLQMWALSSIFQEYRDHSDPKARLLDEQLIDLFDERSLLKLARQENWTPTANEDRERDKVSRVTGIGGDDSRTP
jgi:tyrosine-protein phosphatase SIW14